MTIALPPSQFRAANFFSKPFNLLTSTIIFTFMTNAALAEDFVIVKAAPTSNTQLAIVPFANTPNIVNAIVSNDLKSYGQLNTTTNLPEQPHNSSEVNLATWQQQGVPYLVVGSAVPAGNNSVIGFEVIDVTKNNNMGRFSQPMRGDSLGQRMAGHKIADKIYEVLTGIKGDFSGKIAYVLENGSGKNKISRLMVMDVDGANPTAIYQTQGSITSISPSHDGRKIAFTELRNGYPFINVIDVTNKAPPLNLTPFKANNVFPAFSPDDSQILFSSDKDSETSGIYRMSAGGGAIERLTNLSGKGAGMDISPSWAADGKSFYYVSDPTGNNHPQIFRYTFATGTSQQVTPAGGYSADVRLSNDGKKMAYLSGSNQGVVRDLATGSVTGVNNYGLSESSNFSPNSQHLVYSTGNTIVIMSNGMASSIDPAKMGGGRGIIRRPVWLKAVD